MVRSHMAEACFSFNSLSSVFQAGGSQMTTSCRVYRLLRNDGGALRAKSPLRVVCPWPSRPFPYEEMLSLSDGSTELAHQSSYLSRFFHMLRGRKCDWVLSRRCLVGLVFLGTRFSGFQPLPLPARLRGQWLRKFFYTLSRALRTRGLVWGASRSSRRRTTYSILRMPPPLEIGIGGPVRRSLQRYVSGVPGNQTCLPDESMHGHWSIAPNGWQVLGGPRHGFVQLLSGLSRRRGSLPGLRVPALSMPHGLVCWPVPGQPYIPPATLLGLPGPYFGFSASDSLLSFLLPGYFSDGYVFFQTDLDLEEFDDVPGLVGWASLAGLGFA